MKKYMVAAACILSLHLVSCTGGEKSKSSSADTSDNAIAAKTSAAPEVEENKKGKLIFKQYCVICHGADGKLAVSNATDLSASKLSLEDRITQITNGKGLMTPYKDILSVDQIEAVADYIEVLRK